MSKYTGSYPRKVVATAKGVFGKVREVGAVCSIHKKEQFSEKWMKDFKKGPAVLDEDTEAEVYDEPSDAEVYDEPSGEEPEGSDEDFEPEAGDEAFSED